MDAREERIRLRAYQIWLASGRPEGTPEQHWYQAEMELEEEDEAAPASSALADAAQTGPDGGAGFR